MIRVVLALALLVSPAWAGKKKGDAPPPPADGAGAPPANVPNDPASKAFAERLVKTPAREFRPTDAPGASFIYHELKFAPDNTWEANAEMKADGETFPCVEGGAWAMDKADDDHTAAMTWTTKKTSCPGRPSEGELRVKVSIAKDGTYNVSFR